MLFSYIRVLFRRIIRHPGDAVELLCLSYFFGDVSCLHIRMIEEKQQEELERPDVTEAHDGPTSKPSQSASDISSQSKPTHRQYHAFSTDSMPGMTNQTHIFSLRPLSIFVLVDKGVDSHETIARTASSGHNSHVKPTPRKYHAFSQDNVGGMPFADYLIASTVTSMHSQGRPYPGTITTTYSIPCRAPH
jgi:hypothetical protein